MNQTLNEPERNALLTLCVMAAYADGDKDEREKKFLEELRVALGLKPQSSAEFEKQAEAIATVPLPLVQRIDDGPFEVLARSTAGPSPAAASAESDKVILNYSILNGALELLPQSLATMAIIPLQMKMVYRIGRQHGFELDRGHIRDFLATVGVGMTSQVVEGYARKLLGGLLGKLTGGSMA